ncbi:mesoderm posterior ba [Hypomesus transpacificus]|uniref:mesoderm posterior ba n=1 Tax=Hypomesus transpacificus TaxID=137520 RepID=UPI001F08266A|nr:mesoderm posterior ba [Hypomesus transpacificus]
MNTSSVPLLNYSLQQYQWSCPSSDSDIYSISSPETASPVPSMDYSLSPGYYQPSHPSTAPRARTGVSEKPQSSSCSPTGPGRKTARSKTRVRSKQRESASEKEKLRMRDLTKALHHLRSYLPASVVPAGQTLTKIETLRLTIRYISFLSAQLGLSEDVGDSSACETTPEILGYFQCNSMVGKWTQGQSQKQYHAQCSTQSQPGSEEHSGECSSRADLDQFSGQYTAIMQGDLFNSSIESFLQSPQTTQTTPPSCQMYGKHFCSQLVPDEFWG